MEDDKEVSMWNMLLPLIVLFVVIFAMFIGWGATTMTARMEPIFWMPPTKISNACWKVISFCLTIMIRQVMTASR